MSMWPQRLACPVNAIIRRIISFGLIVIWVVAGTVRDINLINKDVAPLWLLLLLSLCTGVKDGDGVS